MKDRRTELIDTICSHLGVAGGYHDIWGRWHTTGIQTKEAILKALGLPVGDATALEEAYRERILARYSRPVGHTVVCEAPAGKIPLRFLEPPCGPVKVKILPEEGPPLVFETPVQDLHFRQVHTGWTEAFESSLEIPSRLPEGYYHLEVEAEGRAAEAVLAVVPEVAFLPEKKHWGVSLSLYALCSEDSPTGDLGVLKALLESIRKRGGDFVLINPLHYNDSRGPSGRSPYYPLSRLYFNPLYIDLKGLPYLKAHELEALKCNPKESLIDYENVFAQKDTLLRQAFERFLRVDYGTGSPQDSAFEEFGKSEGALLEDFSLYVARRTGRTDPKEALYQRFLQWCLRRQIDSIEGGAFFDLALGTREDGFDTGAFPGALVRGISVGAPPDDFSPKGQDWGFPPMSPLHLEDTGYRYFIELLRRNIPHGGGIRIDHIAGLQRLFWIPQGAEPEEGTYVYYPLKELLGLICLESRRKQAVVIGEDLGTVEPSLREEIHRRQVLSFKVFYFEKNPDGSYRSPAEYPEKALVTTTTHDLPTLWGFYSSEDIRARYRLGRYPDRQFYERDIAQRQRDIQAIRDLLKEQGLLERPGEGLSQEEMVGIYKSLWKSPCRFMALFMDDLMGVVRQQNMPGTVDEYPNWRQRYPLRLPEALERIEEVIREVFGGSV